MTMHHFWAQSGPFTSNKISSRKPVNDHRFFYSCLPTSQKSKSDINLLVKYWWFKNTEISLAESHFFLYLKTRFFPGMQLCRMLMNHKKFGITQIPHKTNDVIFLKSPKTMFWTIFDHFYLIGIFSKNSSAVTHNYIWTPNIMLSFRKN